jgi:hypothetical protein
VTQGGLKQGNLGRGIDVWIDSKKIVIIGKVRSARATKLLNDINGQMKSAKRDTALLERNPITQPISASID